MDHVSSNFLTEAKNLQKFSKSLAPIQPPDFHYIAVLKSQTTIAYRQSLVTLSTNSPPNPSHTQRDFFVVNASCLNKLRGKKEKKLTGKKKKQEELDKAEKLSSFEQDILSKTSPPPPCKSPRFEVQGRGLEGGSGLASMISPDGQLKAIRARAVLLCLL